MIALTVLTLAVGCVARPIDVGGDGSPPTTGIYHLTETRTTTCTPVAEVAHEETEAVVVTDDASHLGVSFTVASVRHPEFWVARSVALVDGANAVELGTCGTHRRQTLRVVHQSGDSLVLQHVDTWAGVADGDPTTCPTEIDLPQADCATTTELRYQLDDPCPLECLKARAVPPYTVTCPC
jgi:hypothetical protein